MKALICVALVGGLAVAAAPFAQADPRPCPPGHQKQGRCDAGARDAGRADSRVFFREDRGRLEEAYRAGYRDGVRVGQRLPEDAEVAVIRDYGRYGLPAPQDGYYYARVDDEVLLIQAATRIVAQALDAR